MKRNDKVILELNEREAKAVRASIDRSLKNLTGGVEWDNDKKSLRSVRARLNEAMPRPGAYG